MNNRLNPGKLLDESGNLSECGYATSLVKEYSRSDIKVSAFRIKEWDYYYVGDDNYGIALTIDDNGYMGLCSFSILDFKNKKYLNHANMFWLPFGKVKMPSSSKEGTSYHKGKHYEAKFSVNLDTRTLYFKNGNVNGKTFVASFTLKETTPHSLVIATPFTKPKHFYYNQKINNMKVSGYFSYGDFKYEFKDKSYGVLDWGRGVWTYANTWYWSSMSGEYNGNTIGFNLGYGFGDTSKASENILFVNDKYYKLDDVTFDIPQVNNNDSFLDKWHIHSKDDKIDLEFTPILDRHDKSNALIIGQDAHQVFGKFNGRFKVNNEVIEIHDMIGFAEKVKNKW